MGADLLEFAVPDIADVVSGQTIIKTGAKIVGRQTLRTQLGSGSKNRSACRVNRTKSAKQTSRWRRDVFTNNSHLSFRVIFGTNL